MDPITALKILRSPRLWKAIGIVALVLAVLTGLWAIYQTGVQDERQRLTAIHGAELAAIREQAAKDLAAAEKKAREAEQAARDRIHQIETMRHEHEQAAAAERDRLLAAVQSGERRLRDRFTCPAASVSGAAADPAGAGQAAARGLQREDAAALVREAERADQVTRDLNACIAILHADRVR